MIRMLEQFKATLKKECPGIIIADRQESAVEIYLYAPALIFQHKMGRGAMIIVPHFDNSLYYKVMTNRIANFFNEMDC